MIEVELPSGVVLEIDTDDPAQAARAAHAYSQSHRQTPAPPLSGMGADGSDVPWFEQSSAPGVQVPPSPVDPGIRPLAVGAQGIARSVADLFGMPVDIATGATNAGLGAANLLTGSDFQRVTNPIGGSDQIANIFANMAESAGYPVLDPKRDMSNQENFAYNVNRLGAGALTGGAALGRTAGGMVGRAVAPEGVVQKMAAPYAAGIENAMQPAAAPVQAYRAARPHLVDQASAVGAATGQEIAEPMDSPIADLVGTLAGGSAGGTAFSAATSPARGVNALRDRYGTSTDIAPDPQTGIAPSKMAVREAARIQQGRAVDPRQARENIETEQRYFEGEGLPVPAADLLSNDEGLFGLGTRARTQDPTPFLKRDREVNTAAAEQVRSLQPEGVVDERAAQRLAETTAKTRTAEAERKVDDTTTALEQATAAEQQVGAPMAAARGTEGVASQDLDRVVVDETLRPRQAERAARYDDIDPDRDVLRDTGPLARAADEIRASRNPLAPDATPNDYLSRIDAAVESGQPISFGDIQDMRKSLASDIAKARNAQDFSRVDNLKRLRSEVSREVERLASEGGPAADRAREALRYDREEFAPFFRQGTGDKLRRAVNRDDLQRSKTPPSATAEMFLRTGGGAREAAADLRRILEIAPDPDAGKTAARNYLIADAARTIGNDGRVNAPALRKWIDDRKDIWSQFPEMEREFRGTLRNAISGRETVDKLKQDLTGFTRDLKRTEAEINRGVLGTLIDNDPENAAKAIFNAKDREKAMRETTDLVRNDPAAMKAWKKSIADHLEKAVTTTATGKTVDGSDPVSWAKAHKEFPKYQRLLAQPNGPYTPTEMQALVRAHRLLEPYARLSNRATAGSDTASKLTEALKPVEALARGPMGLNAVKVGGLMRTIRLYLETIPGLDQTETVNRLVARAQLDPEVAKHLLSAPVDPQKYTRWNKQLFRLIGVAEAGRESGREDEE